MIRKYINAIERFMSGNDGQRFFNFAYSVGAAIVILGALFKILHMPGGNLLLAIGMGTEVLMFILTAFDRPPRQYNWEEVFPEFNCNVEAYEGQVEKITRKSSKTNIDKDVIANRESPLSRGVADSAAHYANALQSVSQELEKLRATTSALNTLYELQLKNVSTQMAALESSSSDLSSMHEILLKSVQQSEALSEEAGKMTENMAKLNTIYAGMISAMTR